MMGKVCTNNGKEAPEDEGKDPLDDACELFFLLEQRQDEWWAQPPSAKGQMPPPPPSGTWPMQTVNIGAMMSAPAPGAFSAPGPAPAPAPGPAPCFSPGCFDMDEGRALPTQGFQGPFVEH